MADTAIEWADRVWNPTTGCDRVLPGCDHCYAMTMAKRLKGMGQAKYQRDGDPRTSGPGFGVSVHPDALDLPLKWRKPQRIFVNSMSDLFHDQVPDEYIARVWGVMAWSPHHTYQILTKRHARMRSLLNARAFKSAVDDAWYDLGRRLKLSRPDSPAHPYDRWPLPNCWLGVSAENQQWADIRIPPLLDTPAAVRFVSAEPLLGPIDLLGGNADKPGPAMVRVYGQCEHDGVTEWDYHDEPGIDWVITGGESGPGARPMHPDWARSLRDQCQAAGVAYLFKQWGEWQPSSPHQEMVANGRRYRYRRRWIHPDGSTANYFEPSTPMDCVGKHRAGRELDGRMWDEYPQAVTHA